MTIPKRSEVWLIRFDPSVGGEIKKIRPAVIVSIDSSNKNLNRVQFVPLTSNIMRSFPCEAYVTVKGKQRKAMADQIATASKERLVKRLGKVSNEDMEAVSDAIKVQLGLR